VSVPVSVQKISPWTQSIARPSGVVTSSVILVKLGPLQALLILSKVARSPKPFIPEQMTIYKYLKIQNKYFSY